MLILDPRCTGYGQGILDVARRRSNLEMALGQGQEGSSYCEFRSPSIVTGLQSLCTVTRARRRYLCLQRLSRNGVKRTFKSWQLYVFTLTYAFWAWATNSNTWIILFLVR